MTSGKQTLMKLAEQQVISCDKTDEGCGGGDLPTAFAYIKSAGLDSQEDYPDTSSASGNTGRCKHHESKVTLLTSKYAIPPCDSGSCRDQKESDLKAALATHGPLSICVNAAPWNDYYGGVLSASCSGAADTLDHCVQLVGYDTTGDQPYWKVKNSWNTNWGEDGFIRLPMGENSCGVADEAMFVTAQVSEQEDENVEGVDCSKAKCPSECACALDKCADVVNACLADATCKKGQDCALACPCHDQVCSMKCVAANPSTKALPVATCIKSKCDSSDVVV